jgi:hypothetical protein
MLQADNFLHTTHRTVSWFRKTFLNDDLELAAPFLGILSGQIFRKHI